MNQYSRHECCGGGGVVMYKSANFWLTFIKHLNSDKTDNFGKEGLYIIILEIFHENGLFASLQ